MEPKGVQKTMIKKRRTQKLLLTTSTAQDLPAKEGVTEVEILDVLAAVAARGGEVGAQNPAEQLFPEAA
jgi:hypothetical protein